MNKYILFIGVGFLISCGSGRKLVDHSEITFVPSSVTASEIIEFIKVSPEAVLAIEGRARSQVSGPNYSERATLHFISDRDQSLLVIRNQLGIEGGRILSDRDSVIMYNPIDRVAWKMSLEAADRTLLNGFSAFNLLDFLIPSFSENEVKSIEETDAQIKILLKNGSELIVHRQSGIIEQIYIPSDNPEAFNRFVFSHHATISGAVLPRRIQLLSNDFKSNIFLHIQELRLNPINVTFALNIPSNIPLERRN